MTKQEFVDNLAEQCELSKADAGRALDAILDSLTESMQDGEEVRFTGFGTFSSQRRRAREGVNPQDPTQKIRIRAAHVPKFKPGASLKAAVADASGSDGTGPEVGSSERVATSASTNHGTETARGNSQDWVPLGSRK